MTFTPQILPYMRDTLDAFMQDTVTVYSVTETLDRFGKPVITRTSLGTVNVQISSPNGNEQKLISTLVTTGIENTENIKLTFNSDITLFAINNEVMTADGKVWNIIYNDKSFTFTAANIALLTRTIRRGVNNG